MTYIGTINAGEHVILSREQEVIVDGYVKGTQTFDYGNSSILALKDVRGIPGVSSANFNLNMWTLVKFDEEGSSDILLSALRKAENK